MTPTAVPSLPTDSDLEALMREALREAEIAGVAGELPISAVVVIDVSHIVFAASGSAMHLAQTVVSNPYARRHIQTYRGGVLAAEARVLLARFAPEMLLRW